MSTTVVKPFSWSYSQLKNFETCPKRYAHYNVLKDVVEPESAQLAEGNAAHKAFELRIKNGESLPLGMGHYERLMAKLASATGHISVEQKLAITSSFTPCTYFAKTAWFRTQVDYAAINGELATIIDYKTGKPAEDLTQLQLMAAAVFIHMPQVHRIKSALVFVNHSHVEPAEFVRDDCTKIWGEILPRVKLMEKARQAQEFPPRSSGLCKRYCAVVSCPHHGR